MKHEMRKDSVTLIWTICDEKLVFDQENNF